MAKPTVLIVDEDREVTQVLSDVLGADGWKVLSEKDGDWALRTFRSRRIDAVVLDVLIPVLNGFQVAEAIRQDPRGRDVPIVMLTGVYRGGENRQEAIERFGLLAYLSKPVEGEPLRKLLREELNRRETALERGRTGPRPVLPKSGQTASAMVSASLGRDGATPSPLERFVPGVTVAPRPAEPLPQALRREPVSLRGTFAEVPFGRVLHELYRIQATGALFLLRDQVKKIIYLDGGQPVAVKSNLLRECLGQVLVQRGRLTPAAVEPLVERARAQRKLLGLALVEQGLLGPQELLPLLEDQLEAKLDDVMGWPDGEFHFKENARLPPMAIRGTRSCATWIVQGVLKVYDLRRLEAEAAHWLSAFPGPAEEPLLRYQPLALAPELEPLLGSLDGSRSLLRLVEEGPWQRGVCLGLVLGLQQAGVIDFYDRKTSLPSLRSIGLRGSLAQPPFAFRPEDPRLEELLASELMKLKTLDHFRVLGLGRTASASEVEGAFDALAWAAHPDRFSTRPVETRELAEGIFGRLRAAYLVLRSPVRRAAYLEQLADASFSPGDDSSEEVEHHLADGQEHLDAGRYEQAAWHFRRAIGRDSRSAIAHARLGFCMHKTAPLDQVTNREALRLMERALTLDPQLDLAHQYLGLLHLAAEDLDRAREHFLQALRLNPENQTAREQLERLAR